MWGGVAKNFSLPLIKPTGQPIGWPASLTMSGLAGLQA